MAVKKTVKKSVAKRAAVVVQPTAMAGMSGGLGSFVTFLPDSWKPWGYAASTLIGVAVPILVAMKQNQSRSSDA